MDAAASARASRAPDSEPRARRGGAGGARPVRTASAVLSIDPRAIGIRKAQPVRVSLNAEYLTAKQLKPLYDRLKATAEGQTPEGMYILYEMLRRCADGPQDAKVTAVTVTDEGGAPPPGFKVLGTNWR